MTGPTAAFEGFNGVWDLVTGKFQLGALGGEQYGIERANLKYFPSEYHSQAPLWMALKLRQRVRTDDIAAIRVRTYHIAHSEIGSEPEKWEPQTRETADHSLPYLLALALMDGAIGHDSFEPARMRDPATRALMRKIAIAESTEFTQRFPAELTTEIEIETRSGERLSEIASYPRGHARNPMTDTEIDDKFLAQADRVLPPDRRDALLHALWEIDHADAIGAVLDRVRFEA
jgi:2-methylcitrate dehydratase